MSGTLVGLFRPGLIPYDLAWAWQRHAAAELRRGAGGERLALLQHPPTYTLGRRTRPEHLLTSRSDLESRGATVFDVDRGGDVTFHGPGQLVAYPILDLRARALMPGDYVRKLEHVAIAALAGFGISGERVPGRPGVWAGGAKIAAIGVRVHDGVSTHGFALNVSTDLGWFDAIIPCGLFAASVTSMAALLRDPPAIEEVEDAVTVAFARVFECDIDDARYSGLLPEATAEGVAVAR